MEKYELTGKNKMVSRGDEIVVLYETVAVLNFTNIDGTSVHAHVTKGPWIKSRKNFSQMGTCWADDKTELHDSSVLEGDAVLYNTKLFNNSKVNDRALVRNSKLEFFAKVLNESSVENSTLSGETTIAGKAMVSNCNLVNLKIDELKDRKDWLKCSLEYVNTETNSMNFIKLNQNSKWKHVTISTVGVNLKFYTRNTMKNVSIDKPEEFKVFQKAVIKNAKFEAGSIVNFLLDPEKISVIIGNTTAEHQFGIKFEEGEYLIDSTKIKGNCILKGSWVFKKCHILDFAHVTNLGHKKYYLTSSFFSDFAEVIESSVAKNDRNQYLRLRLSGDQMYDIASKD